jgi:hypothetical protein
VGTVSERPPTGARTRETHPLLGVFPLTVMSLATFLVLFSVMMARLTAAGGTALSSNRSVALAANGSGASAVRTRASGGGGSGATVAPAAFSGRAAPAIVTSASGAAGAKASGDD